MWMKADKCLEALGIKVDDVQPVGQSKGVRQASRAKAAEDAKKEEGEAEERADNNPAAEASALLARIEAEVGDEMQPDYL